MLEQIYHAETVASAQLSPSPRPPTSAALSSSPTRSTPGVATPPAQLRLKVQRGAWGVLNSAGICQPNLPALFRAPALSGIGLLTEFQAYQAIPPALYIAVALFNRNYWEPPTVSHRVFNRCTHQQQRRAQFRHTLTRYRNIKNS